MVSSLDDGQGHYTLDMRMGATECHPNRQWRERNVSEHNRYLGVEPRTRNESVPIFGTPSSDHRHSALCEPFDSRAHRSRSAILVTYLVH